MPNIELIVHPVRFRIILALTGRELTTQEIAAAIPDASTASLYRHVRALVEGGVLRVTAETPVRGTVERRYAVNEDSLQMRESDHEGMEAEDYLRLFRAFMDSLLDQFRMLLSVVPAGTHPRGIALTTEAMDMTREECSALLREFHRLSSEADARPPGPGRHRFYVSHIVIPEGAVGAEWQGWTAETPHNDQGGHDTSDDTAERDIYKEQTDETDR
jgi:AcrR family transcriptional regulator